MGLDAQCVVGNTDSTGRRRDVRSLARDVLPHRSDVCVLCRRVLRLVGDCVSAQRRAVVLLHRRTWSPLPRHSPRLLYVLYPPHTHAKTPGDGDAAVNCTTNKPQLRRTCPDRLSLLNQAIVSQLTATPGRQTEVTDQPTRSAQSRHDVHSPTWHCALHVALVAKNNGAPSLVHVCQRGSRFAKDNACKDSGTIDTPTGRTDVVSAQQANGAGVSVAPSSAI